MKYKISDEPKIVNDNNWSYPCVLIRAIFCSDNIATRVPLFFSNFFCFFVASQVCGGRAPLVGRLGNRLFYKGPRSIICPVGSVCELPAGLCCLVAVITPVITIAKCQAGSPFKDVFGYDIDCSTASCPSGSELPICYLVLFYYYLSCGALSCSLDME